MKLVDENYKFVIVQGLKPMIEVWIKSLRHLKANSIRSVAEAELKALQPAID